MTYILPQVLLTQVIETNVAAEARDQLACVVGPHAAIYRYAQADEKLLINLGQYDMTGENIEGEWKTSYSWPQKPTGSKVDLSYAKLFIDKALLRYYMVAGGTVVKTARNRIRHPSKVFAANGSSYPASADFLDRGAKVGDMVYLKGKDADENEYELLTYIKEFIGDAVAAITGSATADDANQATVTLTSNSTRASDNSENVQITSLSAGSYSGFAEGNVSETYTVECITAGEGTDYTTAVLRITSASGNDDVASLNPAAAGYATSIGTRGLTATFADDGGDNFAVGDTWTITVREAFTAPVATSGGAYEGDQDTLYVIEVTTGGTAGGSSTDDPYITCSTDNGYDFSGPTRVSASATEIAVGNYGVTIQFDQTKLRKGDRYYIAATAAKEGNYRTIMLAHALNEDIPLNDAATADLEMRLFIRSDIEVDEKSLTAGNYNWAGSQTEFFAFADIEVYHADWTDDGAQVALPIDSTANSLGAAYNKMYLQSRYWLSTLAGSVWSLTPTDNIDTVISGKLTPDNPLKEAAYFARLNSSGQTVKLLAVADPDDVESWTTAFELLERQTETYHIVPLTYDNTVLNLGQTHVNEQSDEQNKHFRRLWTNLQAVTSKAIANASLSTDSLQIKATTEDDSATSGTQYTLLRITSGNFDLIASGVRAGDIVRFKYGVDAWGVESYSSYTIESVETEDVLYLATGTTAAESTPLKVEIHRNLDKNEIAQEIADVASNWADRRVSAVWPDTFISGGEVIPGYHLCACLAGLASGVPSNQGLTRVEIRGVDDVPRTTEYFNRSQLDTMAGNGVHIITENAEDGVIYSRHAVTTAEYEVVVRREEMCVRNGDSIASTFVVQVEPYIGKSNATDEMLTVIGAEIRSAIQSLRQPISATLGPKLVDAEITDLRISPVFADHILLAVACQLPAPFNNLDFTLLLGTSPLTTS